MALIDSESFDWLTSKSDLAYSRFGAAPGGFTIYTSGSGPIASPLGDNYVGVTYPGGGYRNIGENITAGTAGMRLNVNGQNAARMIFVNASGNEQISVYATPYGPVQVYRGDPAGSGSALLGQSGPVVPYFGWFYLEVSVLLSTTTGAVTVQCNGTQVLSVTGVNTVKDTATPTMSAYGFTNDTYGTAYTAHWYFCDTSGAAPWNGFLGDVRVSTRTPSANSSVAFTPSGLSNNWQNAANIPQNITSDFNYSTTTSAQDLFSLNALPTDMTSIYGVVVKTLAVGSGASLQSAMKSGSTTVLGSTVALSATVQQIYQAFGPDPNTSSGWAPSAVSACTPGYVNA